MFYSDVSCNVKNTLENLESLELDKIIHADWMGLLTFTNDKRIFIDGCIDYKGLGNNLIIRIKKYKEQILLQEKSEIYSINDGEMKFSVIISPIREQKNYKIFFMSCSLVEDYCDKDLITMDLITKVSYENVLLNNEIVKERNYLENIFNSTESVIISIDLNGKVTKANRAATDILGMKYEEIIKKDIYSILLYQQKEELEKGLEYVINYNKSYTYKESIFYSKNRGKIVIDVVLSPLDDKQNRVVGIVLVASDITKRKILERELEQVKQFALLGEVTAEVAHEIKNPLMSIRGCARILQKDLSENSKYDEFIQPIISEVDRANEVIEQMLSYARMNREYSRTSININEVIEKCANLLSFYKKGKYISIEKDFYEDVNLIEGNVVRLQQVFINILINAVQAIEKEGKIKIKTYNQEKMKKVVVVISDNGIGINPEKIGRIFQPYYSNKKGGTGLGLSIAKKIVEKHSGDIKVKSKLNKGTEFKILFTYK